MSNSNDNPEITSNGSFRSETSSHVTETPNVETFIIDDNTAEFQLKGRINEKSIFKQKAGEVCNSTSPGTSASPIQGSNETSSESESTSHWTSNTNLNPASNSVFPDLSVTEPVFNVPVTEAHSFHSFEDSPNRSVESSPSSHWTSNTNVNSASNSVLPDSSITEPASNVPVAEAPSFNSFEDRNVETSSTPVNQTATLNQMNTLSAVNSPHSCRTSAIIDSLNTLTSNILRRYRSLVEADADIDVTQRSVRSQIVHDTPPPPFTETEHSGAVTITPPLVPPCVPQGPPPLAGAPPSYSAVMRIGQDQDDYQRDRTPIRIQPSPPFIAPIPPPTYSQAQGFQVERPVIIASVDQLVWGPTPISVICPRCAHVVVTSTQSQRSNLTHFSALGLCLCGCWPCCLLPYCMDTCKNIYHYCPNCTQFLGMYRPW